MLQLMLAVPACLLQSVAKLSPGDLQQLWSGTLHHSKPELACMAAGNNLQLWDVRAGTKVRCACAVAA